MIKDLVFRGRVEAIGRTSRSIDSTTLASRCERRNSAGPLFCAGVDSAGLTPKTVAGRKAASSRRTPYLSLRVFAHDYVFFVCCWLQMSCNLAKSQALVELYVSGRKGFQITRRVGLRSFRERAC